MRAMGFKKPLEEKEGKIRQLNDEYKRYYPLDKHGQLDEWGAVIKRQGEAFQKEQHDKAIQKVSDMHAYSKDLENQIKFKRDNAQLDVRTKEDERNMIIKNQELKRSIDFNIADSYNQQRRQFADGAKAQIDARQYASQRMNVNEKLIDKALLDRDQ